MSTSAEATDAFGAHLVGQLELPYRMLSALAADFTDEEARRRVGDLKPLVWYLGHVAVTKDYFLELHAGQPSQLSEEHKARFGRGSDGSADFADGPSKDELLATLKAAQERIKTFVGGLKAEDLDREHEGEVFHPILQKLGSALNLVSVHDGYHAGQIAMIRRAMGKDPLFG